MSNWKEEIPTVAITQDLIDFNFQCCVCRVNFGIGEPVKKFNCNHAFHTTCIMPWLELHSICPVCRRRVGPNENWTDESEDELSMGDLSDSLELDDADVFNSDEEGSEIDVNLPQEEDFNEDGYFEELNDPGIFIYDEEDSEMDVDLPVEEAFYEDGLALGEGSSEMVLNDYLPAEEAFYEDGLPLDEKDSEMDVNIPAVEGLNEDGLARREGFLETVLNNYFPAVEALYDVGLALREAFSNNGYLNSQVQCEPTHVSTQTSFSSITSENISN